MASRFHLSNYHAFRPKPHNPKPPQPTELPTVPSNSRPASEIVSHCPELLAIIFIHLSAVELFTIQRLHPTWYAVIQTSTKLSSIMKTHPNTSPGSSILMNPILQAKLPMFFQSYAWVDVWSLDSHGLTPEMLNHSTASFKDMSLFSISESSNISDPEMPITKITILEERVCAPGSTQRHGTLTLRWPHHPGNPTETNLLTMAQITKLCLSWICTSPFQRSFLIRYRRDILDASYPIPNQDNINNRQSTPAGLPGMFQSIFGNRTTKTEARNLTPPTYASDSSPMLNGQQQRPYPPYCKNYVLPSIDHLHRPGKVIEIVLHEIGDIKRAAWMTDMIDKDAAVPHAWREERVKQLFGDVATGEQERGKGFWDDIEWDFESDELRYIIHTFRGINRSRKWRSDRSSDKDGEGVK